MSTISFYTSNSQGGTSIQITTAGINTFGLNDVQEVYNFLVSVGKILDNTVCSFVPDAQNVVVP